MVGAMKQILYRYQGEIQILKLGLAEKIFGVLAGVDKWWAGVGLLYPGIQENSEEESKNLLESEMDLWDKLVLGDFLRKLSPQGSFHHLVVLSGQEWNFFIMTDPHLCRL